MFRWFHNKRNGRHVTNSNFKEETITDWANGGGDGLLAIGTIGTINLTDFEDESHSNVSLDRNGGKNVSSDDKKRKTIRMKTIAFLFKKLLGSKNRGFAVPPPSLSLRDPIPEPRIEKMLRTILHKKIYPQSSGGNSKAVSSESKRLENRNKDKDNESDSGSKWVKTDSEYIVLEI